MAVSADTADFNVAGLDANGRRTDVGGRVETGYTFQAGTSARITPLVAIEPVGLWLGAASESFAGVGAGRLVIDW